MKSKIIILSIAVCSLTAIGAMKKSTAINFEPKSDSELVGTATLVESEEFLTIKLKIKGLKPDSVHGFHVHEKGDCSAADAKSAGGHFKPEGHQHGSPLESKHHAGDLGNVTANRDGEINETIRAKSLNLKKSDKLSVMGRALVLHAEKDDLKSQPSGDAGKRIACAVIK